MKRLIKIALLMAFLMPVIVQAQRPAHRAQDREQVHEIRRNVYARVLILSTEEGERFWPIFDRMQGEIDKVREQMRSERKKIYDNYSSLSDSEMEASLRRMLDYETRITDIKRKYIEELKKAIPVKKIALIPKAEREFKKELIQQLKNKGHDRPPHDFDE